MHSSLFVLRTDRHFNLREVNLVERKKKIKITIIILAVLLAISLVALGKTLLQKWQANSAAATVTVPDNLITPEEETGNTNEGSGESTDSSEGDKATKDKAGSPVTVPSNPVSPGETVAASTIRLYNRQPEDNTSFQADNLFPGDAITKYFCVRVSYRDTVTVHYKAAVRPGHEKLAEVLKVRVRLLTSGETLYDGLMSQMPESVTHKLSSGGSATDELYYEITAYLDTSVGNAYQNKQLIADFSWWVDDAGKLIESPDTGDSSNILLWELAAAACVFIMIFLLFTRRGKEEYENV